LSLKPRKPPGAHLFVHAPIDDDGPPPPLHPPKTGPGAAKSFKPSNGKAAKTKTSAKKPPPIDDHEVEETSTGEIIGRFKAASKKVDKSSKKARADFMGPQRTRNVDKMFTAVNTATARKFGDSSVFVGGESEALVVCIPMFGGHGASAIEYPGCLPMEFLFGQTGFPLSLVIQIVGRPGCGKSAIVAEFGRWFDLADGGLSLREAETKFNGLWYKSIMGAKAYRRMQLDRCDTIEDWESKTLFRINEFKEQMLGTKKEPGPGRVVPVLFAIDSLTGKPSQETQEKISGKLIDKETGVRGSTGSGSAGRAHPIEALSITRWLRATPALIDGWPFSLVCTNHLRDGVDAQGNPERVKAGGKQIDFQEGFELQMSKVGGHKKMIECADFQGFPVKLSCEKNSFSQTHRQIVTRILWRYEDIPDKPNKWKQETFFDWDWSTVHLLDAILHADRSVNLKASLKARDFHLEVIKASDIENLAWSKSVGMRSKKDAVSWSELGALIREDADLMAELRAALRIVERPFFVGDLAEQRAELKRNLV
jgi:hypothetical protein